jgi:integrase
MQLTNRQPVGDFPPRLHIGRRSYRGRDRIVRTSSVWWAEWCWRGQHHAASLKTELEQRAVQAAHALRQSLLGADSLPAATPLSWKQLTRAYCAYQHQRGHAPKTVEKYQLVFRTLLSWAEAAAAGPPARFGEAEYWAFHAWMIEHGLSQKTRYDRLIVVKQLFKWAAGTKLLNGNPLESAPLIDRPSPGPQPCFRPEQVARLLEHASGQDQAVFATMAYAGLRFGEVRDLQWDDVLLDDGTCGVIVVRRGGWNDRPKRGRVRRLPVHPQLRPILQSLPRVADTVFVDAASRDGTLIERKLLYSLKELCRSCGFANPQQYKLHTLRHTFASMCARTNVAYKYALAWMGHCSSEVLDLYYTMFDETAEAAIRTIRYAAPDAAASRSQLSVVGSPAGGPTYACGSS